MNKLLKYALIGFAAYQGYQLYKRTQNAALAMKAAAAAPAQVGNYEYYDSPSGDGRNPGEWDNSRIVAGSPWQQYHNP